ncbi:MAG: DAK2 domain-containing protein [Acutalibacteraceae bacterium]|nr:DAK2 domain-containing protein [Acutalibacteraceae bacterium]
MMNGVIFKNAVISAANSITKSKHAVDDLNIFPVPDGDTGTNMSMTINAAKTAMIEAEDNENIAEVSKAVASAMLRGARGNSGVILSLLFKGIAKGFEDKEVATADDVATALALGVEFAYDAVAKPTEGTILTVARLAADKAKSCALKGNSVTELWEKVCVAADDALQTTPELLPVLKRAGVVDSGGKGLCIIFDAMLSVIRDGVILDEDVTVATLSLADDSAYTSAVAEFDDDITFTYCTEFIVEKEKNTKFKLKHFRNALEKIGDCVVVVDDEEIIKVHVHTDKPGVALQNGLEYGQLLTVKVENMKEQHRKVEEEAERAKEKELAEHQNELNSEFEFAEPVDEIGFVAVVAGDGLSTLFKDLGCSNIVNGGQSMNPSTEDIQKAVLATGAKTVFVLPNNKNIIMSAQQVIPLVEDRKVIILPTKTIPQGMSAMLSFEPDLSVEENTELMTSAAADVATGQVTYAARDSEFGSTKIKENEIIALENGKLTFTEKTPEKAVVKLVKNMVNKETTFITVIFGEDTPEQKAEEVKEQLKAKYSNVDITVINGGQPIYYYILSVE